MSGPGLGMGPGLGGGVPGPGSTGSGAGAGGSGSGAGPGGVGSIGAGVVGSGSIGGMTMLSIYPGTLSGTPYILRVLIPEAIAFYEHGFERDRLTAKSGRLEFVRTWELLERFLPGPPATILDIGGGPGAYALPLARAGHVVHLVDAMPLHVEQCRTDAKAAGVTLGSAEVGDARALHFPDASADVVLLLGPLYHLLEESDRRAALAEARRVLRPGGLVCGVGISRFAPLVESLRDGWAADHRVVVESGLTTGTHLNPDGPVEMFTTIHVTRPDELAAELTAAGFGTVEVHAVEGPGVLLADKDAWLDDDGRREWLLHLLRLTESEPSLLGLSPHVLAVGRVS